MLSCVRVVSRLCIAAKVIWCRTFALSSAASISARAAGSSTALAEVTATFHLPKGLLPAAERCSFSLNGEREAAAIDRSSSVAYEKCSRQRFFHM